METVTGTPPEVKIRVLFRERNMEAAVKVEPPIPVTPDQIKKALAEAGVQFGIDEQAVIAAALTPSHDAVRVATGMPPTPGADAAITYYFRNAAKDGGTPVEQADGSVDHRELGLIENVTKGQVLAIKGAPTPGVPGKNVLGEEVAPKAGKDATLRSGQNTVLSEDGSSITSLIDGQPKIDGPRISVQPIVVISGDVDYATGNINFSGSVKVGGNVLPGFTVKASQDVEISGYVEGATIEAGGKVIIKGGVRQHAVITAHGDVTVRYVDSESSITTRANLFVTDTSMHSSLTAGLSIKVGRKLIGGTAQAGEFIMAEEIGGHGGTQTTLDIRLGRQELVVNQLRKAIGTLNTQLATVNQTYNAIIANPNAPAGAYERTKEIKTQLETRLDQLQSELNERQAEAPDGSQKHPFVAVKTGFNPGTHIHFDTIHHFVDNFLSASRISEMHGKISIT